MPIPHFTQSQLIEIYEFSDRSTDPEKLRAVARHLYPDILGPDHKPPIFIRKGSNKWFLHDGDIKPAKYSIMSRLVNGIGIMDDGTPISYDK